MPFNPTTGVFTRVANSFSDPVASTIIDPTNATSLFDDYDDGLTDLNTSGSAGYTTTATAAGTTTLTAASSQQQFFTGVTTQTVLLPVTSTLTLGRKFSFQNNSTGAVTVNSSGSNAVVVIVGGGRVVVTCILTSGTTAASWSISPIPGQFQGTATGDDATTGNVGQFGQAILAFASRTSLTTATSKTVTSLLLPAGDLNVTVRLQYEPAATTSITRYISSVSSTDNTLDQSVDRAYFTNQAASVPNGTVTQTVSNARISLSAATTYYAVAHCVFTVSTMQVWGSIEYRRAR